MLSRFRLPFIFELTKRDFIERFAGSVLGGLWAFIWPLVNLFIYIIVFGKIMSGRLPGTSDIYAYGIYLAVGLIPWTSFTNSIIRTTSVFIEKKHIISKVNVSLISLAIFINLSETVTYLISLSILAVFMFFKGYSLHYSLLLVPVIYYLQQVFAIGLGLLTASLTVFVRDVKEITGVIMQLWFWFTPIVYVIDILPEIVKKMLVFNPACVFIDAYHRIFVYQQMPSLKSLAVLALFIHLLLFFSLFVFRRLEKDIRDFL
ncbi:MAG: ABC transporter permease [Desulfobulbaceae bacterium]|nr:ABC transporter permease [Desulfobulbaceae bacterium]